MPPSFENPGIPKKRIEEIANEVIPQVFKKPEEQERLLKAVNDLPTEIPRLSEPELLESLKNLQKSVDGQTETVHDGKPKSFLFNPFTFTDTLTHKQMISGVTYQTLHEMVKQSQILSAIVNTRVNQVSSFCRVPRTKHSLGFRVQKKGASKTKAMSESERKKAQRYEEFILNCGEGDAAHTRDYFEQFIRKETRDRLIVDQGNFERVFTRGGQLHEFVAVDSATIRIALRKFFDDTNPIKNSIDTQMVNDRGKGWARVNVPLNEKAFVQVMNGQIVCEYTKDEMAFMVAWPRTEINVAGYGYSEVEQLIQTVTAILFAAEYNRRFFSSGSSPKGVLNVKANMSQTQMDAFKKAWLAQLAGITGAWRTPIVAAEGGLEFINMQQTNREMEFSKYNDFLIKVACAVYQIAPEEINFSSQMSNNGQGAVFESKSEMRLKASRDKGLVPLLTFFENGMNREIMRYLDPNYELVFVGLDGGTEMDQVELHEKELKNFKTVNEVRAENDLPPIDGGDILLNSVYAQIQVAEQMTKSQKENLEMTQKFTEEQTKQGQDFQVEQADKQAEQLAEQQAQEAAAVPPAAEKAPPKKKAESKPAKKEVKKGVDAWDFGAFDNFEDFAAEIQKGIVTGEFEKALKGYKDSPPFTVTVESE
ncbi:Phage portal protein [uncultured archaeon]|nr:Phage portal protein [uncultured archaeon]